MTFKIIEDASAFTLLQQQLSSSDYLAIDTEFMRTNTFYPLLGLIQVADAQGCYLVDPLSFTDVTALRNFLNAPQHTLVLHSCSEDLNLLYTSLDAVPAAVFDTQIAAAFLGLGFSLSYQALVRDLLGIDIPKDETRSDWLKRPLSDTQKVYAATDVRYLLELRDQLQTKLQSKGVYEWFQQECEDLLGIARQSETESNWQFSYASINNAWRLSDAGLRYLQQLCIWREQEARRRNKPRSWIAKDADLMQIAAATSRAQTPSLAGLLTLSEVEKPLLNRYASELFTLLTSPAQPSVEINREILNNPLTADSRQKLKDCQRAVQEIATEHTIAPELLGRKKIILELVRGYEQEGGVDWPVVMNNWRRALLEPALTPILDRAG